MLISEKIYEYMSERKMTQLEFAKRTGISQSTVSDWRRKGTNPSADKIMIICEVLDISPYELLCGTENKKLKEYKQTDCVVIDRKSSEYTLLEMYQNLDMDSRKRVEGYVKALSEVK